MVICYMSLKPIIEEAFELANTGGCRGSNDIRQALQNKGYARIDVQIHISGTNLTHSLNRLCRQARAKKSIGR